MNNKIPCSVEILTLNCEKTLGRCLDSVKNFADIIVLDGNSTDQTVSVDKSYGARVYPQKETAERNVRIDDFSEVRNKGVKLARFPWFTFVDSDEYLAPEAVEEIRSIVDVTGSGSPDSNKSSAFRRPRKYVLNGQIIERATTYPNYQLRLFYLPDTLGFAKKVHEIMKLKPCARVSKLTHPEYVPLAPVAVIRQKWSRYLDIQQESLRGLSLGRLVRGLRSNFTKAIKYSLKYFWVRITKKGKPMPFAYEFYNVTYHVRLMYRMIENYFLKWR